VGLAPLQLDRVKAGTHQLEVNTASSANAARRVVLKPDQTLRIVVDLP
jgi:hypothetical protein